mgnify:CR=1 FL=1
MARRGKPRKIRLWKVLRNVLPQLPRVAPRNPKGPAATRLPPPLAPETVAPDSWPGTLPEYFVYQWLQRRGLKEGTDFEYQVNVEGGRKRLFGAVVDFIVRVLPQTMVWRVQGYYWHFARGDQEAINADHRSRFELQSRGFLVIDLLDFDLIDPVQRDWVLRQAIQGVETFALSPNIFSTASLPA